MLFRARADTCVRGGTTNSTGCGWMGAFHFRVSTFCCLLILPFVLVLVFLWMSLFVSCAEWSFVCWCVLFRCLSCLVGVFLFCRALSCIVQKRGKGGGGSRPAATPPVSSHPRDRRTQPGLAGVTNARHRRGRTTPAHESSANSSSGRLASFALFSTRTCFCGAWRGWAVGGSARCLDEVRGRRSGEVSGF